MNLNPNPIHLFKFISTKFQTIFLETMNLYLISI